MDRKKLLINAKIAEQVERYDEMGAFMKLIVQEDKGLTIDERNLFSVAYKNMVGARRSSWRTVSNIQDKGSDKSAEMMEALLEYRNKIEGEIEKICDEVIHVIDNVITPNNTEKEGELYFMKMKGDYYRYLAEVTTGDRREKVIKLSKETYEYASKLVEELPTTHPTRLGLALNHSVFHYEIGKNLELACSIAQTAFDEALADLDALSDDSYKDSTVIMQLLRDNLALWTPDTTANNEDQ